MRSVIALLLTLVVGAGAAFAECPITGKVTADGLSLAGAEIVEKRHGAPERVLAATGPDGSYSVEVEPLGERLRTLTLVVRKTSFEDHAMLLHRAANGCPQPTHRDAGMVRKAISSNSAATPTSQSLCAVPSVQGLTIYLAPYEIFGAADRSLANTLNGDLPDIVHHRILAFQSRLGNFQPEDISVETICASLSPSQGEQIHRVGTVLNALAVIAGDGELRQEQGGNNVVDLDSVFRVLPRWRDLGGRPLQIGDTIPASRLRPSRVAEQLTDLWGKQAVLAVALRKLASMQTPDDKDQVRQMLIELRKTMQDADPLFDDLQLILDRLETEDGQ